jgi:hypothetical protein
MAWDTRKFLVVVKTYPNPSASTNEAVCTAAVDEQGTLTRLFPIPFRTLADGQRFKKWQWIKARVQKASDPRRESYKVDATTIEVVDEIPPGKGWLRRWSYVEHLVSPTVEEAEGSGASLGLIKPAKYVMTFKDKEQPTWTAEERQKLLGQGPTDLFGAAVTPRSLLQKVPVEIRYDYSCDGSCRHHQLFEDWEVGESWRTWTRRYPTRAVLEAAIRNRYVDEPHRKGNLYLWVGTHSRWQEWLVIGHVQPAHLAKQAELQLNNTEGG